MFWDEKKLPHEKNNSDRQIDSLIEENLEHNLSSDSADSRK